MTKQESKNMKNYIKSVLESPKNNPSFAMFTLCVVVGTELFHFVNSLKLNLIMPTLSNVLKESTVRSWSIGNGTVCIRYGNFMWDTLSVAVFLSLIYVLWRFVFKRLLK